jgi:hypothetical protein
MRGHYLQRWGFGILLGLALAQLQACERDGTGDFRIEQTCEDYCAQAKTCNDDLDEDACIENCTNTMDDCMADEQEEALDDLDTCGNESCDDFAACTIGAGLECAFGI